MNRKKAKGVTLVELMIVVAIIAVLATIGYPAYTNYVAKTRRADAKAALMELSQFMERFSTRNNERYDQDTGGTAVALPFNQAPKSGQPKFYNLSLTTLTPANYTLTAVPIGNFSGDDCQSFTINSAGVKGFTKSGGSIPDKRCAW